MSDLIIRPDTKDTSVHRQIYTNRGLEFDYEIQPDLILDLGAYTGISTRWFCDQYPNAEVVGVEPCIEACALASENAPDATFYHAAVGAHRGTTELWDPGFGEWAFSTVNQKGSVVEKSIPQITIDDILNGRKADIIKFDIEGAEKEIFQEGGLWLDDVEVLLVETHDRYIPGSCESVMESIRNSGREWRKVKRGTKGMRREEFAVVFDD